MAITTFEQIVNGNLNNAGNWDNGIPGASDTAIIDDLVGGGSLVCALLQGNSSNIASLLNNAESVTAKAVEFAGSLSGTFYGNSGLTIPSAANVKTTQGNFGKYDSLVAPTYDAAAATAAAAAAQLVTDKAAISIAAADIKSTRTILTIVGTLDLSNLVASNIKSGTVIGGVTGTLDNTFTYTYSVATGDEDLDLDTATAVDIVFTPTDADGISINLEGRTVTFTCFKDFPNNPETQFTKTGVITTSGNDTVTISLDEDDTIPLRCRYELTTDNNVELAAGLFFCH